jgi:hypothetical protein
VQLSTKQNKAFQSFPVYILDHGSQWIKGSAQCCKEYSETIDVNAEGQIKGGASGGPIINELGKLVGIISNFSEDDRCSGQAPRPHLALPVWAVQKILGKKAS